MQAGGMQTAGHLLRVVCFGRLKVQPHGNAGEGSATVHGHDIRVVEIDAHRKGFTARPGFNLCSRHDLLEYAPDFMIVAAMPESDKSQSEAIRAIGRSSRSNAVADFSSRTRRKVATALSPVTA